MCKLNQFIGKAQLAAIARALKGEEGQYFIDLMDKLKQTIDTMPKTYETDGQGDDAPVTLHYFNGGSDWYIIEKDCVESEPQLQAFGFATLNGDRQNAELGYISIDDLIRHNIELDLYFRARTLGEIKKRKEAVNA